MKKALVVLISLFLFASCQKEESEYPLQGHWVEVEHLIKYGSLNALDISDSTSRHYYDKFYPPREAPLYYHDTIYLIRHHMYYSSNWVLDKDRLTVYGNSDNQDSTVYTRIRDNNLWKEEYLRPLKVSVDLTDWSDNYDLSREEIITDGVYGDLFLGYAKDKELPHMVLIEVNGIFIGLDGVKYWLDVERDMQPEQNRARLKVLIHADKELPYTQIEKILKILRKEKEPIAAYQAGISEEIKDLVYRKIY